MGLQINPKTTGIKGSGNIDLVSGHKRIESNEEYTFAAMEPFWDSQKPYERGIWTMGAQSNKKLLDVEAFF